MKQDLELHNLPKINKKKKKRKGRGESSRGKTSGRGGKGASARSGYKVREHYIGGAQPLYRTHPQKGFTRGTVSDRRLVFSLNLRRVADLFEDGETCSLKTLYDKGVITKRLSQKGKLRILGLGADQFDKKVIIEANHFSSSAEARLKELGLEFKITK